MSTRCNVILKNEYSEVILYRHSDGYPERGAGDDLKAFVKGYTNGSMRNDPMQSAGWLILRGHLEDRDLKKPLTLKPDPTDRYMGWKASAYEPTNSIHGDIEYLYIINLDTFTLEIRQGRTRKSKLLESVSFAPAIEVAS